VAIKQMILLLIYLFNEELRLGMANLAATVVSTINPSTEELVDQIEIMKDAKVGQIVKNYIE
jgi:hypothetical protein